MCYVSDFQAMLELLGIGEHIAHEEEHGDEHGDHEDHEGHTEVHESHRRKKRAAEITQVGKTSMYDCPHTLYKLYTIQTFITGWKEKTYESFWSLLWPSVVQFASHL